MQKEITGFQILRVCDGDHALKFLNRSSTYHDAPRPVLVLLDLNMPNRDGFQILKQIRDTPTLATLPVAIFTASQNPADRERAFTLGASHFIQKPSGLEDFSGLATRLSTIIRHAAELPPE